MNKTSIKTMTEALIEIESPKSRIIGDTGTSMNIKMAIIPKANKMSGLIKGRIAAPACPIRWPALLPPAGAGAELCDDAGKFESDMSQQQ